jgi:hypothetical protein
MNRPRERGAVLLAALMLAILATTVGTLAIAGSRRRAGEVDREVASAQARWAAEGAIARARVALGRGVSPAATGLRIGGCDVDVTERRVNDASVEVTACARAKPDGERGLPLRVRLRAVLRRDGGRVVFASRQELR